MFRRHCPNLSVQSFVVVLVMWVFGPSHYQLRISSRSSLYNIFSPINCNCKRHVIFVGRVLGIMKTRLSEAPGAKMDLLVYAFQSLTLTTKLVSRLPRLDIDQLIFRRSTRKTDPVFSLPPVNIDELICAFQALTVASKPTSSLPPVDIYQLPTEILAQIFKNLSNKDILNLPHRICAKGLFDSKGQRRFSRHRVWLETRSLQSLTRVSYHPVIRRFIQELSFGLEVPSDSDLENFLLIHWMYRHRKGRHMPKKITLESFHTLAEIQEDDCQYCRGWPSLSQRWTDHRSALRSWRELQCSRKGLNALAGAFRRFENFKRVSIDNFYRKEEERRKLGLRYFLDKYKCDRRFKGTFAIKHSAKLLGLIVSALSISDSKPNSFRLLGDASGKLNNGRKASVALNLSCLRYEVSPAAVSKAFSNLKKIELRGLWRSGLDTAIRRPGSDMAVNRIVESAISLEELTLHYTGIRLTECINELPLLRLYRDLGPDRFVWLKKLDLAHFTVQPQSLSKFLKASAKSLEDMMLTDILLRGIGISSGIFHVVYLEGAWESTFDDLKDSFQLKTLRLDSLKILSQPRGQIVRHGFGDVQCEAPRQTGGDKEALAWLCGNSEINPFRLR